MAKLKLTLTGTLCDGVYPNINISFNGVSIESNLQLSASPVLKTYDVTDSGTTGSLVSLNTLTIDNINNAADWVTTPPPAHFTDNRTVIVSGMEYAVNGTDYKTYITQSASSYTVPSGPNTGLVMILTTNISQWNVYSTDYALEFDSVGIISTTGTVIEASPGGLWRLVGPNFYNLGDEKTYDINGNVVG